MILTDAQKQKNAEVYLERHGMRLEDLTAHVPALPEGACAVFTGGIPKGFGHDASDIDLLILGASEEPLPGAVVTSSFQEEIIRLPSGHILNIYHISTPFLDALGARVRQLVEAAFSEDGGGNLQQFNDDELEILHWVHAGFALAHPDNFARWQVTLGSALLPLYIYSYFSLRATQLARDATSFLGQDKPENALWTVRISADHLATAVLGVRGVISVSPKWQLTMIRQNADLLGRNTADRLVHFLTSWRDDAPERAVEEYVAFHEEVMAESQAENINIAPLVAKMLEAMV